MRSYPNITSQSDYRRYRWNVAHFLREMDGEPSPGKWDGECDECEDRCECEWEPYFSWRTCDCCGRNLGGDRVDVIGWIKGARDNGFTDDYKWSGAICVDCLYFLEYGQLDDMTMMDVYKAS